MKNIHISLEFFPPNSEVMAKKLWDCVNQLQFLYPSFVSVTYGAGGSTRERTHSTINRIIKETSMTCAAHLTCVGATKNDVNLVAENYWNSGIRHIVALRGDPPDGKKYHPTKEGYKFASDLVSGLMKVGKFEITVAAYPEIHPEALSAELDLDNLKRKIDSGAVRAITQFFFDNSYFFQFLDRAHNAGIKIPIIPGIMPITNFERIIQFSKACGTTIPQKFFQLFHGLEDDPLGRRAVARDIAIKQCEELVSSGIENLHFYTLNRSDLTKDICKQIGITELGNHHE